MRNWVALIAPAAVLWVGWWLWQQAPVTGALWVLGILLGAALQRSRFCVAAALRDPILFCDVGPARAVLVALALSSVTFGAVQAVMVQAGGAPVGSIQPVTAGTVAGAFLFGLGLLPAGGCMASTLVRAGEGYGRFLVTLAGAGGGSLLGAYHYGWFEALAGRHEPVHLPAALGWGPALVLQFSLLGGLYVLLAAWERRGCGQA